MYEIVYWLIILFLCAIICWLSIDWVTFLFVRRIYEIVYHVLFFFSHHAHSVLMIDIDHFRRINKRYGHSIGDKALRAVARIIKREAGSRAFRFGGDEFVILLPFSNRKEASRVALKLIRNMQEKIIFAENKKERITISVGIGENEEKALIAIKLAKEAGRNTIHTGPE
ncbi:MAG TPA: GGDEF domain-containing protein [Candidatus Paceibacterota bacterium]|nr:GGDEF domain-containing protein [Candidatus Paceibacterota bacterium]